MTDNMLGPCPMHIKYVSYVYDRFCIWRTNFPGPIESVISKFTCTFYIRFSIFALHIFHYQYSKFDFPPFRRESSSGKVLYCGKRMKASKRGCVSSWSRNTITMPIAGRGAANPSTGTANTSARPHPARTASPSTATSAWDSCEILTREQGNKTISPMISSLRMLSLKSILLERDSRQKLTSILLSWLLLHSSTHTPLNDPNCTKPAFGILTLPMLWLFAVKAQGPNMLENHLNPVTIFILALISWDNIMF